MKKLSFLLIVLLGGCTTAEQQRVDKFIASPVGQFIENEAAKAAANAIDQYAATGKVNAKELAKDAVFGASAELRSAQTPGKPSSAAAAEAVASQAVHEGSNVAAVAKKVAPAVAKAIAAAVKTHGAPADLALEAAARGLDKAAASVK